MTTSKEPSFTIGIEEEYLLVDPETRDLAGDPPATILEESRKRVGDQVTPEFLRSQIEVGTKVCTSISEATDELRSLRCCIRDVAQDHGLAMIAASTHPIADWDLQKHTEKDRYNLLAQSMQTVARRLLICGMHVHVGIEDDDLRIDLMNQIGYFLPHLLALSTSAPFWRGRETGLKSYRMAVWNELPRTGLPPQFDSYGEYRRLVTTLVNTGVIEDATKLWWDVRPSDKFPTLEMRMTDICTRMEDAICIAAFYRCELRMLWRLRWANQRWRQYDRFMVSENRWRASRYGTDEGLIDFGKGAIVPLPELLEELIALVREDAEFFDCVAEIEHARVILERGTSAHNQVSVWQEACQAGKDEPEALRDVVDMLIEETAHGL
ncbi:MAG: carboxylate-amine ligase [Acidiferrobacteraceae bacterium]|jgi:carboxylate-amine ligase|nr:carboxylate-amine ligase [Acidiferrobacteraceae bacterium]MDP6434066.1 carboxylate-amine ligase [Arenicellales bacterium]MDP6672951.1 carboxylate-amine ligase [Arenicellales bacterium]MDP6724843.1 carboxylate-amine ligase [Arenicellales bacterium]|tara:strand:- start:107 stop:1246 length:1140 start_codon:yes stop_codon:yes gene_type:complete